jgi:parvulin-like peptidyl-prolyl isomerase
MENQTEPLYVPVSEQQEQKVDKKTIRIKISKKTAIIIAVIIVVAALAYVYKGLFIAATVDGSPISRFSIISKLEKASGKSLLDSIISEKLIENEVKSKGIKVSDEEVEQEIAAIKTQLEAQSTTLEAALKTNSMTMEDLRKQIILGKQREKLVAGQITVTDEEVAQYVKDYSITIPKGEEEIAATQIRNAIISQKTNEIINTLLNTLKSQASIRYFVNY